MKKIETGLPGVFVIKPDVFSDARGFFFESYQELKFSELGITTRFVQDNHSRSARGTLRGLHYQPNYPQAKLCRVIQGEVFDVAVDIRYGSPNFGKWAGVLLSAENKDQILIPKGFAHGFLVLSETAEFLYKCDAYYHLEDERGVAWNDPDIGIQWDISAPILSGKDSQNPFLAKLSPKDLPRF
ncbi:MAG TPA: dTDP-4-dehydrorhamnose 3,5-epimerase [Nitrospiria bacterium]|nr:dTDP-4-dehydrorhamnose 3,5-epimerase [Nitrospiria bacterium]